MLNNLLKPVYSPERSQVVDAIHHYHFKVVPEEIALKEGMPLNVVTDELNALATETRGNLRVSKSGQIQYLFEPHFETEFVKNAARNVTTGIFRVVSNIVLAIGKALHLIVVTLFRLSIGILLIASVVAVIALIALSVLRMFSDDNGDFDLGGDFSGSDGLDLLLIFRFFRYFIFDWVFDWLYWDYYFRTGRPRYGLWSWFGPTPGLWTIAAADSARHNYFYGSSRPLDDSYSDSVNPFFSDEKGKKKEREDDTHKVDFLTICYEFVFGCPDPNIELIDDMWKAIVRTIRNNNGVVTAEQLAPYTGEDSKSEDWMIPIMTRFGGKPEVTDTGNIVYVFDKFRPVKKESNLVDLPVIDDSSIVDPNQLRNLYRNAIKRQPTRQNLAPVVTPHYLKEEYHHFVSFPSKKLAPAMVMGIAELGGSIFLIANLANYPELAPFSALIYFLLGYGIFFFAVPLVRLLIIGYKNTRIEERNNHRIQLFQKTVNPAGELKEKMSEAQRIRADVPVVSDNADQIVYTTEKEHLEQLF